MMFNAQTEGGGWHGNGGDGWLRIMEFMISEERNEQSNCKQRALVLVIPPTYQVVPERRATTAYSPIYPSKNFVSCLLYTSRCV